MAELKKLLIKVLENYKEEAKLHFPGNGEMKRLIEFEIPDKLKTIIMDDRQILLFEGAIGKGQWATIPWVAIMDKNLTTTVSQGVYIVYLFCADGSGAYLTLNQGTGGINEARILPNHEITRNKYLSKTDGLDNFSKGVLEPNSLRGKTNPRAKAYEQASILWKYYSIENLRTKLSEGAESGRSNEPVIGIEEGGINVAESLLLARYFMFSQVYFHPIRRAYDTHLKDFLLNWLPNKKFSIGPENHIKITDNEVNAGMLSSYYDTKSPAHNEAKRMIERKHFKLFYSGNQIDLDKNPRATDLIFEKAKDEFGFENIRRDRYPPKKAADVFPVYLRDGRIVPSIERSSVLNQIPIASFDYLFIEPDLIKKAEDWRNRELSNILKI